MLALTDHEQLEVSCPSCPVSYAVALDLVEECQRLLDEVGPCTGPASYECPAPYFASLATPEEIARHRATPEPTTDATEALARWENEGGASEQAD